MRKTFYKDNSNYNIDNKDFEYWQNRIKEEILPTVKDMYNDGYILPEIVAFVSDQINYEMVMYRLEKEIEKIKYNSK